MVIVAAGRRVDAPDATVERFPPRNVPLVRDAILAFLKSRNPHAAIAAAACGADLLFLEAAGKLGIRRQILIPGSKESFRESSVVDRPGDWGELYDRIIAEVEATGRLRTLDVPKGQEGYLAANAALLDAASSAATARGTHPLALVIWNGESRGDDDVTAQFRTEAGKRGFPVEDILTL
jgi:hypothetical protein